MRLRCVLSMWTKLCHSGRRQWPLGEDQCRCPPLCKALRSRADNSWPKPADRPSAGCKQWEPMSRAVILRAFTVGLDDQGNAVLSNLPESIWWRRDRIQEARSRTRHPALLCGRTALYWLGISHPNVRAWHQGCYSM